MFAMTACDEGSPTSSNTPSTPDTGDQTVDNPVGGESQNPQNPGNPNSQVVNAGEPSCTVTTTANSVTTVQTLPGVGSYTSTAVNSGSRYSSITSEYWYADNATAADECQKNKEEASHWLDGSMKVTCSGNKIFVEEVDEGDLSEYEADFRENCEEFKVWAKNYSASSNPSSSTDPSSTIVDIGGYKCEVIRSGNSVAILQSYRDLAFEEKISFENGNSQPVGMRTMTFTDAQEAAEECRDQKDQAEDSNDPLYKVVCSGKTVVVTKRAKDEFGWGVDGFEDYYKSWCEDQKRRLKNGEIDMLI
jgi:hypothetical protein